MEAIEKLFKEKNNTALHKFENQDFKKISRIHDWRAYVPEEIIHDWSKLTNNERKLVFIMCEKMVDEVEWSRNTY